MDLVGHGIDEIIEESACCHGIGLLHQLSEGKLRGAIDGYEKVELAFFGSHFGNVNVKEADRIEPELLLRGLVTNLRQATNAVTLQTAMQIGASELRNACLESIETIIIVVRAYVDGKLQSLLLAQS